ncbi:MAG: hypothetical protein GX751_11000 [Desulfuromonadaceae bacterium]|nr:hypothetical protein [Desulfuromonadaceae bacterium]
MILDFELGLFYQKQNRFREALAKFRQVLDVDSSYRDVAEKVIELQNQGDSGDFRLPDTATIR